MPKVDMDMATGTIAAWHAADGDFVEKGHALFDIETDKAAMEVEAPATGQLHIVAAGAGVPIAIGEPVAWILADGEAPPEPGLWAETSQAVNPEEPKRKIELAASVAPSDEKEGPCETPDNIAARATPVARRLARERAIDISLISGSGPRGRITKRDVEAYLPGKIEPAAPVENEFSLQQMFFDVDQPHERIPVDRMRATIAARLTASKTTVPHFYLDADCRLDALLELRKQANAAVAGKEVGRISINDYLIRASALALTDVPHTNASWAGDAIIRYLAADISIAVAIDGGLVTPVIRDAASLSVSEISRRVGSLAEQAMQGKLAPEAYRGGSFSISNLGMFGVKSFAAIINPPQSMILAVGEARRTFVPDDDDKPVAATVLPITLSCDHRVVDGAAGAQWLQCFRSYVENPLTLLV